MYKSSQVHVILCLEVVFAYILQVRMKQCSPKPPHLLIIFRWSSLTTQFSGRASQEPSQFSLPVWQWYLRGKSEKGSSRGSSDELPVTILFRVIIKMCERPSSKCMKGHNQNVRIRSCQTRIDKTDSFALMKSDVDLFNQMKQKLLLRQKLFT